MSGNNAFADPHMQVRPDMPTAVVAEPGYRAGKGIAWRGLVTTYPVVVCSRRVCAKGKSVYRVTKSKICVRLRFALPFVHGSDNRVSCSG
jgi:hypothetical protein